MNCLELRKKEQRNPISRSLKKIIGKADSGRIGLRQRIFIFSRSHRRSASTLNRDRARLSRDLKRVGKSERINRKLSDRTKRITDARYSLSRFARVFLRTAISSSRHSLLGKTSFVFGRYSWKPLAREWKPLASYKALSRVCL